MRLTVCTQNRGKDHQRLQVSKEQGKPRRRLVEVLQSQLLGCKTVGVSQVQPKIIESAHEDGLGRIVHRRNVALTSWAVYPAPDLLISHFKISGAAPKTRGVNVQAPCLLRGLWQDDSRFPLYAE